MNFTGQGQSIKSEKLHVKMGISTFKMTLHVYQITGDKDQTRAPMAQKLMLHLENRIIRQHLSNICPYMI